MPLITFDRLKVHQRCNGDIDRLYRVGSDKEKKLFDDKDGAPWELISSVVQNIELISKKLASSEFTAQTLIGLKENCDEKSFIELTDRIPFYEDFQKIAVILSIIKDKISFNTDVVYTHFENICELGNHIDSCIKGLQLCDFEKLTVVSFDFAPTGTYQELSMRNDWADEYLKIAEQFDGLHKNINSKIISSDIKAVTQKGRSSNTLAKLWSWLFSKRS